MVAPAAQPSISQRVVLVAKPGGTHTGVGRYVAMLREGLTQAGVAVEAVAPALPPLPERAFDTLRRWRIDLRAFLRNYPVWAGVPSASITHLTSQNLASMLLFRRPPTKIVVTVHDIIPYLLRNDPALAVYRSAAERLFDRMAMAGLRHAHQIIADSHYTRQTVIDQLSIVPERISVVHLGVDHERYCPQPVPLSLRQRYALPNDRRFLLYVGSEDPRKNLLTLVQALAAVRQVVPNLALLKVGRPHFDAERERLQTLARQLGVLDAIFFLDDVPEADLPLLYNLADVCVMPSRYEGFGFPVLEAMACGTPVVCANSSSLPELAGDAALLFPPENHAELAMAIVRALDPDTRIKLYSNGIAQASRFDWEKTTRGVLEQYNRLGVGSEWA